MNIHVDVISHCLLPRLYTSFKCCCSCCDEAYNFVVVIIIIKCIQISFPSISLFFPSIHPTLSVRYEWQKAVLVVNVLDEIV